MTAPKIIVATDFSECSDHALKAGEEFRRITQGTLEVVHVAAVPLDLEWMTTEANAAPLPRTYHEEMMKDLKKHLDHQVRRCEVKAETQLISGLNHKDLVAYVKKSRADLLIVGHKGAGAVRHLMGSFTTKLVATNEVPLLVINTPLKVRKIAGLIEPEHPVAEIFTATDKYCSLFRAQTEYISVVQDIGALSKGMFYVREKDHVRFTEDERAEVKRVMEARIREFMNASSAVTIRTEIVPDETVSGALTRILQEENVDLAILSRNRQNIVEKIFIGSVARKVLETYPGNFLVLPPTEN